MFDIIREDDSKRLVAADDITWKKIVPIASFSEEKISSSNEKEVEYTDHAKEAC